MAYQCPKHHVSLIKKEVLYGYPAPGEDYSNVILGGCCISSDSPKHGFECSVGKEVYFLDKTGTLIPDETEEIEEDPEESEKEIEDEHDGSDRKI